MTSKKDCLSFARRLYVDKESAKSVAKSAGLAERTMAIHARTAITALISKEKWTVRDVMTHLKGNCVPIEMRREAVSLHKAHGLAKAVEMTGVPMATLGSWVSGNLGGKGLLSMGRRSWARLEDLGPAPESGHLKRKARRSFSQATKEQAVHRFTNEGVTVDKVAEEFSASQAIIYQWRREILGKISDPNFNTNARKLAKQFVVKARVSDQMGDAAPERGLPASSMRTIQEPGTFVDAPDLESLSAELAELGHLAEAIAKDREIVTLKIENEQLRRQLNDR